MARAKVPRKSTAIDMTPFCDVAFLLLTFFILTTKFKPDERVTIHTPSSVASKTAPEKNFIQISLDQNGKVFLNSDRADLMQEMLDNLNTQYTLGLVPAETQKLAKMPMIGVPLQQLKSYASLPDNMINAQLPGIPIQDTANNQLSEWMKALLTVTGNGGGTDANGNPMQAPTIILKGDNLTKFPRFKNVILALTGNNILKFDMVTNPVMVPKGSELWKQAQNAPAAKS
jgi:biopolymer transport protein ExbD